MSDFKSKLPNLNELMSMMDTLYTGIKDSIHKIVSDYQAKHSQQEPPASVSTVNTQPVDKKVDAPEQKSEPKPEPKPEPEPEQNNTPTNKK